MSKIVAFRDLSSYTGKYLYLHNTEDGNKGRFIVDGSILKKDITDPKFPTGWRNTIPIIEACEWGAGGWNSKNLQFEVSTITDISHMDIDP